MRITLPRKAAPAVSDQVRVLSGRRLAAIATLSTAILLHLAGLLSLHFGFLDPLFSDTETHIGKGADFFAIYSSGHNFVHGITVYGPYQDGSGIPYAYPFRYLPSVGFSFGVLLSLVPPWSAYWGWVGLNECLLLLNVLLTWRLAPCRLSRLIGTFMWLVFTPFYIELFMGQFSLLMGSVVFWLGLAVHSDHRRGLLATWTASLLIKTNSLILLPVAFQTGWFKQALKGMALAAALNLPYFLLTPGSWDTWSSNFDFAVSGQIADPHAGNLGLSSVQALLKGNAGQSVWAEIGRSLAALPWGLGIVAASLAVTALSGKRQVIPLIALWTCAYFLIHDEVWEHHYVMLLPVLVLLVMFEPKLRPATVLVYALIALPTPYAAFQTMPAPEPRVWFFDPQPYWSDIEIYVYHLSKVLPVLALWGMLGWRLARGESGMLATNVKTLTRRFADSNLSTRPSPARHLARPRPLLNISCSPAWATRLGGRLTVRASDLTR
jgi:hypothetical protein